MTVALDHPDANLDASSTREPRRGSISGKTAPNDAPSRPSNVPDANRWTSPKQRPRPGSNFHVDQTGIDTLKQHVGVDQSQPSANTPAQINTPSRPAVSFPSGQTARVTQRRDAGGGTDPQQSNADPSPTLQAAAASNVEQVNHLSGDAQLKSVDLFDPALTVLAGTVDDLEGLRQSLANRLRILTTAEPDSDGRVRGFGLDVEHPAAQVIRDRLTELEATEHRAVLALQRQIRKHPLGAWVKAQKGLGDKTIARLLGEIGDPYWNTLHDRPRTIGELFAYCGVSGPGKRHHKGQPSNWNDTARVRLYCIADPIVRGNGPFRAVYDAGRAKYADKVHTSPCAQCGAKGKPAETGAPWRPGHQHAGAMRIVMREVLRGLWTEARRLHEAETERAS